MKSAYLDKISDLPKSLALYEKLITIKRNKEEINNTQYLIRKNIAKILTALSYLPGIDIRSKVSGTQQQFLGIQFALRADYQKQFFGIQLAKKIKELQVQFMGISMAKQVSDQKQFLGVMMAKEANQGQFAGIQINNGDKKNGENFNDQSQFVGVQIAKKCSEQLQLLGSQNAKDCSKQTQWLGVQINKQGKLQA